MMNGTISDAVRFMEALNPSRSAVSRYKPLDEKERRLFYRVLGSRAQGIPDVFRGEVDWFATSEGRFFARDIFNEADRFLVEHHECLKELLTPQMLEDVSYSRLKLDMLTEQMSPRSMFEGREGRLRIDLRDAPVYLKLYEEVADPLFVPFLSILQGISLKNPEPHYADLKIRSKMEVLESCRLGCLTRNCRPTVRNAIGHGGVFFEQFEVVFRDDKGNEERFLESEFPTLVISLVDDLNAIMLALDLFFMHEVYSWKDHDLHTLPVSFKKRTMYHALATPHCEITGVEPAASGDDLGQLNVYCHFSVARAERIWATALYAVDLARRYFPSYGRVFVGVRGDDIPSGWIRFKTSSFLRWLQGRMSFEAFFREVAEDSMLSVPFGHHGRMHRYWRSLAYGVMALRLVGLPVAVEKFGKGVDAHYDLYYTCNVEDRSTATAKRIKAEVILLRYPITKEQLVGIVKSATRYARKIRTRGSGPTRAKRGRRKADYVWLSYYSDCVRVNLGDGAWHFGILLLLWAHGRPPISLPEILFPHQSTEQGHLLGICETACIEPTEIDAAGIVL